jgi:Tfp pilus assembly protein PilF
MFQLKVARLVFAIVVSCLLAVTSFGQAQPTTRGRMGAASDMRNPAIIHGQVLLDTGTPLGQSVEIYRICGSKSAKVGTTNAQGKFSTTIDGSEIGNNSGFASASDGGGVSDFGGTTSGFGGLTRTALWGCSIRASAPGYVSSLVSLQGKDFSTPIDMGTLVLHKPSGAEASTISATSLKAPEPAKKEFDKGREDFTNKKYDSAQKHLDKATDLFPDFAEAWDYRGRNERMLKQDKEAEKSFLAAIKADEKYVMPYMQLAGMNAGWGAWPNVLVMTNKVIEIDPVGHPDAYFLNAFGHYNQKEIPEAETSARKAVELDKAHQFPRAALLLGDILKDKGDDKGAAEQYRNYLMLEPNSQQAGRLKDYIAKAGQSASK